jgi:hypothetical protein
MCCGSKRSAWRSASLPPLRAAARAPAPVASAPAPPAKVGPQRQAASVTRLHYTDSGPVRLRGPITGRGYAFSGAAPVQEVDVRDAAVFLRSGRFRPIPR